MPRANHHDSAPFLVFNSWITVRPTLYFPELCFGDICLPDVRPYLQLHSAAVSIGVCRPFHLGLAMTKLGSHYTFLDSCSKNVRRDCFYSANKRLSILCYIKSVCWLFILTCLAFSSPRFLVPYFTFLHFHVLHFCATFSSLAFSSPADLCRIFHSCIFQPCNFPCAAFSWLAFSVAPFGAMPRTARRPCYFVYSGVTSRISRRSNLNLSVWL